MLRPSLVALGLAALVGLAPSGPSFADARVPFALKVEDATAKVGQPTAVRATVIPPEGMKLSSVYRHRLIDLSAFEDRGVQFDDEVVIGTVADDGSLPILPGSTVCRLVLASKPDRRAASSSVCLISLSSSASDSRSWAMRTARIGSVACSHRLRASTPTA
jgi:hypothetical protein